jgi:T5SS/PEP-CTERM-associated repeat protein
MKTKTNTWQLASVMHLALMTVIPAVGGDVQWTGDAGYDSVHGGYWWVAADNWDPGVPLDGDTVYLTDDKATDTPVLFGSGNPPVNQFYIGQSGGGTMILSATNPVDPESPFITSTRNVGRDGKGEVDNDWISHTTHTLTLGDAAGEDGVYHCHNNGWDPVGNVDVGVLLMIGNAGTGKLELSDGGTALVGTTSPGSATLIGYQDGSSGTLIVRNPGSHFDTSTAVIVGFTGSATGAVSASNAGVIEIDQACTVHHGTLDVTGVNSSFSAGRDLTIGKGTGNEGVLTLIDSGEASSDGACIIGEVDGYSSEGHGKLDISLGGDLESAGGVIGRSSVQSGGEYSVATVDGTGSSWTSTGDLAEDVASRARGFMADAIEPAP